VCACARMHASQAQQIKLLESENAFTPASSTARGASGSLLRAGLIVLARLLPVFPI